MPLWMYDTAWSGGAGRKVRALPGHPDAIYGKGSQAQIVR